LQQEYNGQITARVAETDGGRARVVTGTGVQTQT
jgi:hypothetical protein